MPIAYRPLRGRVPLNPLRIPEELLSEPASVERLEVIVPLPNADIYDGLSCEEADAKA